jgi:hypothetical protein
MRLRSLSAVLIALLALGLLGSCAVADDDGFTSLFNGKDLTGWSGADYRVEDGVLVCPADGGGTLLSTRQYANFVLRLDFKVPEGGNNGVGIRTPAQGDPAYVGMEIQVLDDYADVYKTLQPWQYCGSVYGIFPAKRGITKPAGEWNSEEILVDGTHVRVKVNGKVVSDGDTSTVADPELRKAHPGLDRIAGHVGFMGHGSRVEFRKIRIKELPGPNTPPEGFKALFDGFSLDGWKGLVANPPERAKMAPEQLAEAQKVADDSMRAHWSVDDAALCFDGKGEALCTAKDYGNFEMFVDWKIEPGGDSGIYLRGSPQVQIWEDPVGSGGLYNNQQHRSKPIVVADNPPGQWNTFRIKMVGDRVSVWLNGKMVAYEVVMENYWERDKPIYPIGQIELQNHGSLLWFRNIFIRELPDEG